MSREIKDNEKKILRKAMGIALKPHKTIEEMEKDVRDYLRSYPSKPQEHRNETDN